MEKVLIVDGNSLAFATPPTQKKIDSGKVFAKSDGRDIYITAKFMRKLMNYMFYTYRDHKVIVTFDDRIKNTFRHKLDPTYKQKPIKEKQKLIKEYVYQGVDELKKSLDRIGIPYYSSPDWEADDVIGMLVDKYEKKNAQIVIITSDADIMQLLSKNTKINLIRDKAEELITPKDINKYLPCDTPSQVIDVKALWGDQSDNIRNYLYKDDDYAYRGVKGDSIKALKKYGNIDNLYDHLDEMSPRLRITFERNREAIDFNLKLVTIIRDWKIDVPLEHFTKSKINKENLFNELLDLNQEDLLEKRWFNYGVKLRFNKRYNKKPYYKNR